MQEMRDWYCRVLAPLKTAKAIPVSPVASSVEVAQVSAPTGLVEVVSSATSNSVHSLPVGDSPDWGEAPRPGTLDHGSQEIVLHTREI